MKRYYMYIPLDFDKQKNTRFVVEVDDIPKNSFFSGKVVARNSKAYYHLGHTSNQWVNPVEDLKSGHSPSFIPIRKDYVLEKFDEQCIE